MTGRNLVPGSIVVGCGVVGDVHANALAQLQQQDSARFVGVVDLDRERAERFGAVWQVRWSTSLVEALSWPDADIAHICTPSGLHAQIGIEVARSGRHVLVEKPIDVSLDRADALISAAFAAGITLGVVSQHRFDPGFRALQTLVQNGSLGRLVLGEARVKWYRSQDYYSSATWRGTWSLDGGGALINQSIHYVDLLLALCGDVAAVSAYTATACHDLDVEDIAAAVLRFASGATGTILGSTAIFPGLPERLEISGTDGTAVLEDGELVYTALRSHLGAIGTHGDPGAGSRPPAEKLAAPHAPPYGGRHTDQIADFVEAVRLHRPPAVTGADGRRALALVRAIYASAAERREVLLPGLT